MSWTQLNPNVWQRVYADGTVGIVRRWVTTLWTFEVFPVDGTLTDMIDGVEYEGTLDEMKSALDKRFDPQPEMILGGEKIGCDWTFYQHGTRAAMVHRMDEKNWECVTGLNMLKEDGTISTTSWSRAIVEAEAIKHVLGTP